MPALTQTSRVKQHVLDLIRNNVFDSTEPLLSERKLSEATGTSRTTVRRAMKELIDAGILVPKRGSGTYVNRDALEPADKKHIQRGRVGILFFGQYITAPGTGYGWEVLQAISKTLSDADWSLNHLTPDPTPGTLAAEKLASQPVDGLIWVSPSPDMQPTIEALHEKGMPLVLVNQRAELRTVPTVMVDRKMEGQLAASHLLALGHRDILYIGLDDERPHLAERYQGFAEAFLSYRSKHATDLSMDSFPAQQVGPRLDAFLQSGRSCSAIFVADTLYLPAVLATVHRMGRRVPEDLSLVSHSVLDATLLEFLQPSQVQVPLRELGHRAAQRMMAMLAGAHDGPTHELLVPTFEPGTTCLPLAR